MSSRFRMTRFPWSLLLACLAIAACATAAPTGPPTVNVTGNWAGNVDFMYGMTGVTMTLKQTGSDVTGELFASGQPTLSGPVVGTVSGNRLSLTYGNGTDGAELVVAANEMNGTSRGGYRFTARRG